MMLKQRGRALSILMTAVVMTLASIIPAYGLEACDEWQISKDKTATALNENYETEVMLSLPAEEEEIATDIVFVLDKSTSPAVEEEAAAMLDELKTQVKGTEAKVNVGVVIFNKEANIQCGLTDLESGYSEIEAAIKADYRSGTNTHAGLIAGNKMLAEDTAVDNARKHLIFVSDGITYMFNEEATAIASEHSENAVFAGPDCWDTKYGNGFTPKNSGDWEKWIEETGKLITKDAGKYDVPYEMASGNSKYIPYAEREQHAMTIDRALYNTYSEFTAAKNQGFKCHVVAANPREDTVTANYPWAKSFMEFLAADDVEDFSDIKKEVLYLLDADSTVIDVIGQGEQYTKDGKIIKGNYDFQFVNAVESLKLTVGGQVYDVTPLGDNKYGFGDADGSKDNTDYPFVLTYYPQGTSYNDEEHFKWDINVPVKITEPVQLTYMLKLMNPRKDKGKYTDLFTNVSAILYPIDSNGNESRPEEFERPQVQYEVASSIVPVDTEKDTTAQAVASPKTGDSSSILLWAVLAATAALIFAFCIAYWRSFKRRT